MFHGRTQSGSSSFRFECARVVFSLDDDRGDRRVRFGGHSSSKGMNASSSRTWFHRASTSLIDAFLISSRMTASYVWPFVPNLRSISFVSFRREMVVAPAMFLYARTP